MSTTLCMTTTTAELDVCNVHELNEDYATTPMLSIRPGYQPIDEELLHSSFEQAISDRVIALHLQHADSYKDVSNQTPLTLETDPCVAVARKQSQPIINELSPLVMPSRIKIAPNWQFILIYLCAALMLIMLGFDIMGLLVLHMH